MVVRGYRTLTQAEWDFLLNTRIVKGNNGEGYSYQIATINSDITACKGMIIYPDDYISQTTATTYTSSEWATMETNGCVFLPSARKRENGTIVSGAYYWILLLLQKQPLLTIYYLILKEL